MSSHRSGLCTGLLEDSGGLKGREAPLAKLPLSKVGDTGLDGCPPATAAERATDAT